jgi:phosphopantothenate-cysteine ligase
LEDVGGAAAQEDGDVRIGLRMSLRAVYAVRAHQRAQASGALLSLGFVDVAGYMHLLRLVAKSTAPLGARAMLCFAAAVADFYVPASRMKLDKIQSSEGVPKDLGLQATPKMLGLLRTVWNPGAFCVSFKLETDASLLHRKATEAARKYGMHCVCANLLQTRYDRVVLVDGATGEGADEVVERGPDAADGEEIEAMLVAALARRHAAFGSRARARSEAEGGTGTRAEADAEGETKAADGTEEKGDAEGASGTGKETE